MNRGTAFLSLLLLGLAAGPTLVRHRHPASGPSAPSPLLYVRVIGPAGSRITVYQGGPAGTALASPVPLALRAGYVYRIQLSNLPHRPGVSLYPTIEVRG